nr:hypothetical protein [Tanacetum cinerariifolium]
QKSHEDLEATQNVEKVKEHLMAEEIKKLVEGLKNVEKNVAVHSSSLRNDDNQTSPDTRIKFEILQVATTSCRPFTVRLRDQEDPHDDAHPEGENSAKRQKTSEYGTFKIGGSSAD